MDEEWGQGWEPCRGGDGMCWYPDEADVRDALNALPVPLGDYFSPEKIEHIVLDIVNGARTVDDVFQECARIDMMVDAPQEWAELVECCGID